MSTESQTFQERMTGSQPDRESSLVFRSVINGKAREVVGRIPHNSPEAATLQEKTDPASRPERAMQALGVMIEPATTDPEKIIQVYQFGGSDIPFYIGLDTESAQVWPSSEMKGNPSVHQVVAVFKDSEGYVKVEITQPKDGNDLVRVPVGVFSESYMMGVGEDFNVTGGGIVMDGVSTDADTSSFLKQHLDHAIYPTKSAPDVASITKQREALEAKGVLISRDSVIDSLNKWKGSIIESRMPDERTLMQRAIDHVRSERVKSTTGPSATPTPSAEPLATDADVIDALAKVVKPAAQAEAAKELATDPVFVKAEAVIKRLESEKGKALSSDDLYEVSKVFYGDNTQDLVKRNEAEITRLTRLKEQYATLKDEEKIAEVTKKITGLLEQNGLLTEGIAGPDGKKIKVDFDTGMRRVCDLVASGQGDSDPLAMMFKEFMQDPTSSDFGKKFNESQQQKAAEIIDKMAPEGQKGYFKGLLEQWGPKLGFVLLILLQQTITEMGKGAVR